MRYLTLVVDIVLGRLLCLGLFSHVLFRLNGGLMPVEQVLSLDFTILFRGERAQFLEIMVTRLTLLVIVKVELPTNFTCSLRTDQKL